jgi:hypothetical protein
MWVRPGAYPRVEYASAVTANAVQGCGKVCQGPTLAYYENPQITVLCFIVHAPVLQTYYDDHK